MKISIKNTALNLSLLGLTAVIFFVVLEIGHRVAGFHGMNVDFKPVDYSEAYGWKLKQNYSDTWENLEWKFPYRTNSWGFRGPEWTKNKASKKRAVILGDSFAEGFGVADEDMWTTRLSKLLGPDWEVINLGVRGYDILQEYRQFSDHGIELQPDLVIQSVCGNDLGQDGSTIMGDTKNFRPPIQLQGDQIVFLKPALPSSTLVSSDKSLKKIFYKSAFLTHLRKMLVSLPGADKLLQLIHLRKDNGTPTSLVHGNDDDYNRAIELAYKNFIELSNKHGFRFSILWVEAEKLPGRLQSIGEKFNIPIREILYSPDSHFRYDAHPNAKGSQEIAEQCFSWLKTNNLIDAP